MVEMNKRGEAVREKCADLAEASLKHLSPFDDLKYESTLDTFSHYIKRYSETDQERFIKALISVQRFRIGGEIFRNQEAFELLNPIREQISEDFFKNVNKLEHKNFSGNFKIKDAKDCLSRVIERDLSDFKKVKPPPEMSDPGVIYYARQLLGNTNLLIGFDPGTMSPGRFTPYLAITDPPYTVPLSAFLGGDKDVWYYYSPEECEPVVTQMIFYIKKIIPIFSKAVLAVLNE